VFSDREHIWVSTDALREDPVPPSSAWQDAFQDLDYITPEFDQWLAAERSRRSKRCTAALKREAEVLLRMGLGDETLALVEQMNAIDPHDEDALRLGMEAEFERGHPAAIAERYCATAALLFEDLGVRPSEETRGLRDRLIRKLTANDQHEPLSETDPEYFARRAGEEREAAARTETQVARKIHERLAERYEQVAVPLIRSNRELETLDEHSSAAEPARFLRKSLVIQAVQWFKHGDHAAVFADRAGSPTGHIETPEGRLRVDPGDWIITGVTGEHYPCKPHIFQQLYAHER